MKNLLYSIVHCQLTIVKKFVLLFILSFAGLYSNAQIHADFTATPQAGCAPLVVNFNDISTGDPSSWRWDLGNGTISFLQNPSVTYFNPGQYSVKLVIKNSAGTDSIIKSRFIKVYSSPEVNFSGTPQSGCFPLPAQFTDLSKAVSGTLASWEWDFGDGVFSTKQNPQHTYLTSGNFNVSLRVTNNFGCITSITNPQYIQISSGVNASFTNTFPVTCNKPANIQFSNTSTGIGILSYKWNFGDGGTSTLADPTHTYSVGSYTVSLIVFNSNGCSDTIVKPDLITLGKVNADFSVPPIICEGNNINFVNTSNPAPSTANWDFGDGTFSNAINPVKAFTNPGNYTVKMIAGFGACRDTVTKQIEVIPKPVINFIASPSSSCKAPLVVNFTNLTPEGNKFSWNFGDGAVSVLANPSHTYLKEGFYNVKLTVTNLSGCTNSTIKKDFIKIKSPVITLTNLPQKGCAPLTNTFTAKVSSVDSVINYTWNFGDGNTSVLISPTHTYNTPGAYTVSLVYTTSTGCTDSVKYINAILVGSKPVVNFSATPRDACASTKINFTDLSTGEPNEWQWFFGDGAGSLTKNPEHLYNDTGYFAVTLIALNNGCADTLILPNYLHIKAPIAKFKYNTTCIQPGHVVFTDLSIGADSWEWMFGDGTSSSLQNPMHDYTLSGVYTVQLKVANNTTGCDYTKIDTVNVLKEIADFTSSVTTVCKNGPVDFMAVNSIPGNISSYTWRFGDGITISSPVNSITHTYTLAGSYNVTMILGIKNGCKDSIVKPLAVKVDGPTAVFKTESLGACQNNAVNFIDSSYANGTHTIQKWQWNWGDGVIQTLSGPSFQHTYTTPGNYSVTLKVTDNTGCTDSVRHVNTVTISKPIASFKADTVSCSSNAVAFTNLSTGPQLKYLWDFGDGTTSIQLSPFHTYAIEGTYTVSLAITDQYGCSDFISKANYVRIADPKANFKVSDTAGTCPPLVVNFTNFAINYTSFIWNFGDGTTSSSLNPSHFYATPGTFNAVLNVKGAGGCSDQKSIQIKVKGPIGSFTYKNISGCKPLQTNFKATTGKKTTFIWDFNDGVTNATPDSVVSHIYKSAGFYLPKMILVDTAGCRVPATGIDSIRVYEVLASFTNPQNILCDSGRVAFTNTTASNDMITDYFWTFGDNTNSTLANPIHNYLSTGNYTTYLKVTSKNGCNDSVAIITPVKIVKSPEINIDGKTGACTPAVLTFKGLISAPDTSSLKWKWDFANGNISTLQNPPVQNFPNAGFYPVKLIATNSSGCTDTVIKIIEAYALPDLKLTADTALCIGASLALKANDSQTYKWSPSSYLSCTNCEGPLTRPDSAIKYFVTGTNGRGCVSTDSVFIDVKFPNTVKVSGDDTLCSGSSVRLFATGAETYTWSPTTGLDDSQIASPNASPGTSTTYTVTGSDTKGCFTSTASVPVKVYPIPVVNAGIDKTINAGKSFDIIPEISPDITSLVWNPSVGIIARNYPGITVKPVESIEYTIEVKNEGGCSARDRISIYVLCDNSNVFVPNTFSPNADGVNDIFYPRGSGVFSVKSLRIFNRWGEVVFEKANFQANDAGTGWDGTFKGKKLPADVFVFALEVVCSNNQSLVFKGNVALIK